MKDQRINAHLFNSKLFSISSSGVKACFVLSVKSGLLRGINNGEILSSELSVTLLILNKRALWTSPEVGSNKKTWVLKDTKSLFTGRNRSISEGFISRMSEDFIDNSGITINALTFNSDFIFRKLNQMDLDGEGGEIDFEKEFTSLSFLRWFVEKRKRFSDVFPGTDVIQRDYKLVVENEKFSLRWIFQ